MRRRGGRRPPRRRTTAVAGSAPSIVPEPSPRPQWSDVAAADARRTYAQTLTQLADALEAVSHALRNLPEAQETH